MEIIKNYSDVTYKTITLMSVYGAIYHSYLDGKFGLSYYFPYLDEKLLHKLMKIVTDKDQFISFEIGKSYREEVQDNIKKDEKMKKENFERAYWGLDRDTRQTLDLSLIELIDIEMDRKKDSKLLVVYFDKNSMSAERINAYLFNMRDGFDKLNMNVVLLPCPSDHNDYKLLNPAYVDKDVYDKLNEEAKNVWNEITRKDDDGDYQFE